MIDFIDSSNHQLVWRGIASDAVQDSPQDKQNQIAKGSRKLVERFKKDAQKQSKQLGGGRA